MTIDINEVLGYNMKNVIYWGENEALVGRSFTAGEGNDQFRLVGGYPIISPVGKTLLTVLLFHFLDKISVHFMYIFINIFLNTSDFLEILQEGLNF